MFGIVYLATNKANGKMYIGITTEGLNKRMKAHISESRRGSPNHFHRAIRKHGERAFFWRVIDVAESIDELLYLERIYIDSFDTYLIGYNMTHGGDGTFGFFPDESILVKKSAAMMGNKNGLGVRMTEDNRAKLAKRMVGNTYTVGIEPWNKGVARSDETRRKISESLTGRKGISRPIPEDAKSKISESLSGRKLSEQHRANISAGSKGKGTGPRSEQSKENIRIAQRKRRERERMEKQDNARAD